MSVAGTEGLKKAFDDGIKIRKVVEEKAMDRFKAQGLDKHPRIQEGGDYFGCELEFAMKKMTFYMCFKCKNPYFGGMVECADLNNEENEE